MTISLRHPVNPAQSVGATPGFDLVDWSQDTLVDLLRRRAAETPRLTLYTFLEDGETRERSMSAADLDHAARRIGQSLAKFGKPGDRAILLFDDGVDYIAGLFGCLAAGLVAVSGVHPAAPRSPERLLGIVRDCQATIVLGHARVLAEFQRALDDVIDELDLRWVPTDLPRSRGAAETEAWMPRPSTNGSTALIQYTSGSSRDPRGVMLTHRNILHNLRGQMIAFGYRPGDTGVSWLPFSHDMGLIGCVLMAIYGGGRCVLLSPSHFLEDPSRWLRAMSRYRATLSGGPSFAFDLCAGRGDTMDRAALDLSNWAVAVNGAEPIRADVVRRFAETFAPAGFNPAAIHPSYGLAEATLLVTSGDRLAPLQTRRFDKESLRGTAPKLAASPDTGKELVGCGRSLPDQRLAIVDPQTTRRVTPGDIGEIWIAGPSISAGYFGRDDENALYFGGDLGDGAGAYYKTGDLGFVRDDELYVTGRSRDLIIVRGKNYYPQDLEQSAEASHPALRPGSSAAFLMDETGELVAVCELLRARHEEAEAASAAIREAIIRDHGINPRRIVLTAWGSVLKTPSGKIQRAQTRVAYGAGHLSVVHESAIADRLPQPKSLATLDLVDFARIEAWFVAKMGENGVDVSTFDPTMRLTELGFDSLKIVELKADLERDLGIVVHVADLYAFEDVKSLADFLRTEAERARTSTAAPAIVAKTAPAPVNKLAEQRRRRGAQAAAHGGPASL